MKSNTQQQTAGELRHDLESIASIILFGFVVLFWAVFLPFFIVNGIIEISVKWWACNVEPMEGYIRRELVVLIWIAVILAVAWAVIFGKQ